MAETKVEASDADILLAQRLLSASARHDIPVLSILLKDASANVRDPATGTSPLHAAIEACAENKSLEPSAVKTVHLLLENGAIWNDLNKKDETPGCIALRLGLKDVYDEMVMAGVRAELLFGRMKGEEADAKPKTLAGDNNVYLASTLRFNPTIILDEEDNAVMMQWEDAIMARHAETLLPNPPGLRIMNVGHGMGIVDRAIQARSPDEHHIIEAHPQVLARLKEQGWHEKKGVTVHEGRWQDVLPKLMEKGVVLDAIYYDTFAEDYAAFKEFTDGIIPILDEEGRFGWYNGLGADRQIVYDVMTKVAEMDLYDAGFDTKWEDIAVPADLHGSDQWNGTRRPYWQIDTYRLPVVCINPGSQRDMLTISEYLYPLRTEAKVQMSLRIESITPIEHIPRTRNRVWFQNSQNQ
ncbi:arginine N-methyltransferase 2 [Microthyrium microscopicum]|uniref:Arginine N-methyltransferase 2 n=1 Tax=Microthyrium microscopicum TaxID=703497 RepID=A0A6A6UDT2_9PEZI|nr:arginine N-methyltransferase 2 [Microthyrium microscopicum]